MNQTDDEAMVDDCEFKATGSQSLLYRLVTKNDWTVVSEVEGFLFIFDHLPDRMRVMVDLKMSNVPDDEVAAMLGIKLQSVRDTLCKAKKRFLKGIM